MARLLVNREWYDELSSSAVYEKEFEKIVLAHCDEIFPEYHMVPFKKVVESEYGNAAADFALVHKEYKDWWVMEVELAHHSLEGHVLPQVRSLANANYDQGICEYLCSKLDALEEAALSQLISKGAQPRVIVVVNKPSISWSLPLRACRAILMVLEIFRSNLNKYTFRINGEPMPQPLSEVVDCVMDPLLPRFLKILNPVALPEIQQDSIEIDIGDGVVMWQPLISADCVYLVAKDSIQIKKNQKCKILRTSGDVLRLEKL